MLRESGSLTINRGDAGDTLDVNALSVFPLIVRLRNDRDLRSGMRFLTVDDEIRTSLEAAGGPDGTGQLTGARLFRRPASVGSGGAE